MSGLRRLIASGAAGLLTVASVAWAGPTSTAPEPGTFELLALGGVLALVIGIRNRRGRKKAEEVIDE